MNTEHLKALKKRYSQVADAALEATGEIRALIKKGGDDLRALEDRASSAIGGNWDTHVDLSVARVVRAANIIVRSCGKSSRLLDYGSLFGNLSLTLRKLGFEVDALESYQKYFPALEQVRAHLLKAGVRVVDASAPQASAALAEISYGGILLLGAMKRTFPSPRLLGIRERLDDEGVLVLDTMNRAYVYDRVTLLKVYRKFSRAEVERMLETEGFQIFHRDMFNCSVLGLTDPKTEDQALNAEMESDPDKREFIVVGASKTPGVEFQNLSEHLSAVEGRMRRQMMATDALGGPSRGESRRLYVTQVIDVAAQALRLALAAGADGILNGDAPPAARITLDSGISRSSLEDFVSITNIWNRSRHANMVDRLPRRSCPACDSDEAQPLFMSYDGYPYQACCACGTWYVAHAVEQSFIDEFLQRNPEAAAIAARMAHGRNEYSRDADRQRFGGYFQVLGPLMSQRGKPPRYLDIGCGVGHSVEVAQELGFEAFGTEINPVALEIAAAAGRNVSSPDHLSKRQKFDLVSAFETLEHVTDPQAILEDISVMLVPDGLCAITVPNRSCYEIAILRERCLHVYGGSDGVGHINLFDRQSLELLLDRTGFSLIYSDGQYGSNILKIAGHLLNPSLTALDVLTSGQREVAIPDAAFRILNAMGPALNHMERVTERAPILLAVACKKSARKQWLERTSTLSANKAALLRESARHI